MGSPAAYAVHVGREPGRIGGERARPSITQRPPKTKTSVSQAARGDRGDFRHAENARQYHAPHPKRIDEVADRVGAGRRRLHREVETPARMGAGGVEKTEISEMSIGPDARRTVDRAPPILPPAERC